MKTDVKEQRLAAIDKVKATYPIDEWADKIKEIAIGRTGPFDSLDSNWITPEAIEKAESIIAAGGILTWYLRHEPRVMAVKCTKTVFVDDDGKRVYGLEPSTFDSSDALPPGVAGVEEIDGYRRTICKGTPYGCLVAFEHEGKLLIGWSRLNSSTEFTKSECIEGLYEKFSSAFEVALRAEQSDPEDNHSVAADLERLSFILRSSDPEELKGIIRAEFVRQTTDLVTATDTFKRVEQASFSKKAGKVAAVVRAFNSVLAFKGVRSPRFPYGRDVHHYTGKAGDRKPVPNGIAETAQKFVLRAATAFDKPISNAIGVGLPSGKEPN